METIIINTKSGFIQLGKHWNDLLNRSYFRDVLYSHEWYKSWIENFGQNTDLVIAVLMESGIPIAILPLCKAEISINGFKIKILKSLTNYRSVKFDMISSVPPNYDLFRNILQHVFIHYKCDVVLFENVLQNSIIQNCLSKNRVRKKFNYIERMHSQDCLIRINCRLKLEYSEWNYETFMKRLKPKFRKNILAAQRKAIQKGDLQLLSPNGPEEVRDFIDRSSAIEAASWKGDTGYAMNKFPEIRSFYQDIGTSFFEKDWLRLYLLRLNGDDIAFLYCVHNYGIVNALKIGSKEEYHSIGPGMIITKMALNELFLEGKFCTFNFCGGISRWKEDWSNDKEGVSNFYVFSERIVGKSLYMGASFYDKFGNIYK